MRVKELTFMARRYSNAWANSTRKERLPNDWQQRRKIIIARASRGQEFARCEKIDEETQLRCANVGRDVDHVQHGDDHSITNLMLLCQPCHRAKSAEEGVQARAAHRARRYRPAEPHPGAHKELDKPPY